jgi:hypothetical protein
MSFIKMFEFCFCHIPQGHSFAYFKIHKTNNKFIHEFRSFINRIYAFTATNKLDIHMVKIDSLHILMSYCENVI